MHKYKYSAMPQYDPLEIRNRKKINCVATQRDIMLSLFRGERCKSAIDRGARHL